MRTKALIHLDNFAKNLNSVRTRIGKNRHICVPVKADAYGHGALQIAETSLKAGAFCLGTAAVSEAVKLRNGGIKAPILIFSQPLPEEIPGIINENFIPFISDMEFASILNEEAGKKNARLSVHLKIDTGMGRIGCSPEESLAIARYISSCKGLELTGIATHFAVSDSTDISDIEYTKEQLAVFKKAIDIIRADGINPGIIHAANSGAVILHPESWFDMVRPGIILYGYKTAEESELPGDYKNELSELKPINVKPVMELRSKVTLIKKIKKGDSVSYGRTWTAENDTYIAILSTGYADGFPRLASNKWQVQINGRNFPVAGRITMEQCCVDLCTNKIDSLPDVDRWDDAVIFGGTAADAMELASVVRTIPYEITCNVNKRVPRVYS